MSSKALPKIERGIPIPPRRALMGRWYEVVCMLKAGDSFMVDGERDHHSAMQIGRLYGVALTSRKINGEGYRIWRKK